MQMLGLSFPPITREFHDHLDKMFKRVDPVPNVTTIEELMFSAGARAVVDYMERYVRGTTITGGHDVNPNRDT